MPKVKERYSRCDQVCGAEGPGMREVQLTHSIQSGVWQHAQWICLKCRERLRGYFRYVRR